MAEKKKTVTPTPAPSPSSGEKKKALEDELKEYEEYSNKLEEMLNGLLGYGMTFTFRMN